MYRRELWSATRRFEWRRLALAGAPRRLSVAYEERAVCAYEERAWTDLRAPEQLYPRARLRRRRVVYHGGPTNSGKTHWALEALKRANNGVYAGPLRLLAVEVYERLNTSGVYCSLFTGQERREVPFASHASCTIEMVPVGTSFDVAVIDEIQLIGSEYRGHAWTRALQGLDAGEIHVCGALDAAQLVEKLCDEWGDSFELREYKRMTPLTVADAPMLNWKEIRSGDCVVTFSRDDIHAVRREIETQRPGIKCGVVYGQLPPETRTEQARLFNDGFYHVLVASDAIGMGLNLNIGRIIFRRTEKFGNVENRHTKVEPTLVKQIAGRAGRRNSKFHQGVATAMSMDDLNYVREAMASPDATVAKAGIFPPAEVLAGFAAENQGEFNDLVKLFSDRCQLDDRYFLCTSMELTAAADKLAAAGVSGLAVDDHLVFATAPCNLRDRLTVAKLTQYAAARAKRNRAYPNVRLPTKPPTKLLELHDLCSKHNVLDMYLWLAFRFPDTFTEVAIARAQKTKCINLIARALASTDLQLPPELTSSSTAGAAAQPQAKAASARPTKPASSNTHQTAVIVKRHSRRPGASPSLSSSSAGAALAAQKAKRSLALSKKKKLLATLRASAAARASR